MIDKKLTDLVNQSGFPLQIALADSIHSSRKSHHWEVVYSEHAWKDREENESGFADLVVRHRHTGLTIVIECKRVLESEWIFHVPGACAPNRREAKAWATSYANGNLQRYGWLDLAIDPATAQSEFCVIPGQDSKAKPMIERIAADLVSSTAAIAKEERSLLAANGNGLYLYFCAIVTTAKLKVCVFDPTTVTLEDGKLPSAVFDEVPFLRFRKQLSTRQIEVASLEQPTAYALARAKEQTVFVIEAEAIVRFLSEFELDNHALRVL